MMQVLMRLMIFSTAVSAPVVAHAQLSQDHSYGWHSGGDWGHMMFGPLMMLVFVAVVIVVVVLAVRWLGGAGQSAVAGSHPHPEKAPLDILKERFASGEIDKEEFEERRHILSK